MRPSMALQLLQRFEAAHGLRLPGLQELDAKLQFVELRARQSAFVQGMPSPYVYVVRNGLLKQFYTKEDGTDWIKSFTGSGDLFACPHAIGHQAPAAFSCVAIEHSIVERIDFRHIERIAETSLPWQKAIRLAFQGLVELKVRRERDLLMLSARELYANLMNENAHSWISRVPQKDLAGYLGVTPVGLNRIIKSAELSGLKRAPRAAST